MTNRTEYVVTKDADGKYSTKHGRRTFKAATLKGLDAAMTRAKVPLYRTFRVVESKA